MEVSIAFFTLENCMWICDLPGSSIPATLNVVIIIPTLQMRKLRKLSNCIRSCPARGRAAVSWSQTTMLLPVLPSAAPSLTRLQKLCLVFLWTWQSEGPTAFWAVLLSSLFWWALLGAQGSRWRCAAQQARLASHRLCQPCWVLPPSKSILEVGRKLLDLEI